MLSRGEEDHGHINQWASGSNIAMVGFHENTTFFTRCLVQNYQFNFNFEKNQRLKYKIENILRDLFGFIIKIL